MLSNYSMYIQSEFGIQLCFKSSGIVSRGGTVPPLLTMVLGINFKPFDSRVSLVFLNFYD